MSADGSPSSAIIQLLAANMPRGFDETDRRIVILGQIDAACTHPVPLSNRQLATESLAHQPENATLFVEHSFNMTGHMGLPRAKSATRKLGRHDEEVGCDRH